MEETNKLLIHIISCIFDLLKKHFKLLLSMDPKNKGIYDNIKILIMKCLERYLTINNPDKLSNIPKSVWVKYIYYNIIKIN